jgi:dihydrofolate reductase
MEDLVRKIIVTMWTTLDGFVAGPADEMDWLRLDDELQAYETDLVGAAETLMLGRVTFNDFAGYWPQVARNSAEQPASRRYAQVLDGMEKIVVSASGQLAEWNRTRRWRSVDRDAILDLEKSPGGDIVVYGSLSLVEALTELGLVDEFHLLVHPVILRDGKPLLRPGRPPVDMQHLSTRILASGVALTKYRPAIPDAPSAPSVASTTNA